MFFFGQDQWLVDGFGKGQICFGRWQFVVECQCGCVKELQWFFKQCFGLDVVFGYFVIQDGKVDVVVVYLLLDEIVYGFGDVQFDFGIVQMDGGNQWYVQNFVDGVGQVKVDFVFGVVLVVVDFFFGDGELVKDGLGVLQQDIVCFGWFDFVWGVK